MISNHTIATQDFMLKLVHVQVQARHNKGFQVLLPAVVFNEENGSKLLSETNIYLRKAVEDPMERYLFTRSMPDFVEWLHKEMNSVGSISDLSLRYSQALELSKGSTFDIFQIFMDAVFSECMALFK